MCFSFFFFNDTATTEIYTLSLHDALPIFPGASGAVGWELVAFAGYVGGVGHDQIESLVGDRREQVAPQDPHRSEEHTSELQSQSNLVCRLLLEKTKIKGQSDTRLGLLSRH